MDKLIHSCKLTGYRPVLADNTENYKRFVQIRKKFEKDLRYRLFAEPKIDSGQGVARWFSPWEGDPIPLTSFSEIEQEKYLTQLKFEVEFLFEECRKYQNVDSEYAGLLHTLEKCIEIPDFSFVFLINAPNGERHFVLTMWGFINDAFNAKSGLIRKIIPKNYRQLIIKAKYPNGNPAAGETVSFENSGNTRTLTANQSGIIVLEDVLVNSSVIAYQLDSAGKKRDITNFNFLGQPEQEIIVRGFGPMKFLVKDSTDIIRPSEKFIIDIGTSKEEKISDITGEFLLSDIEMGSRVKARHVPADGSRGSVFEFECERGREHYLIILPPPGVVIDSHLSTFLLLDSKRRPIPGQEIKFEFNGQKQSCTTDDSGRCRLENLLDNCKVKAIIRYKKGTHKKKVTCKNDIPEYILRLRNRKLWWLLLLLLLIPLMLLIPLKKDIAIRVVDANDKKPIEGATVNFSYHERYLLNFSSWRFLSNDITALSDTSDANGMVLYSDVHYSVFQWLFFKTEQTNIWVISPCFSADTLHPAFSNLQSSPETLIEVKPFGLDLDFLTVNAANNEPIPGAKVQITIEGMANGITDTTKVDGKMLAPDLPLCGRVLVIASCYGYINDTISASVTSIRIHISKRTLHLKPITRSVTFYVKNLKTRQPLPGATCKLIIDGRVVQTTVSNTNGAVSMIGEATFENVHVIKQITIQASKIEFNDTSRTAMAQRFMDGTTEFCTLYLRPMSKVCDIRVIDANTGAPIEGAQAIMTRAGEADVTEFSNINGIVQFAGLTADDIISIAASKDPDYLPNSYSISGKLVSDLFAGPQSGRDIPLKSKGPPPLPCETETEGANVRGYDQTISYNMGQPSGEFMFEYFTDFQPDAIYVYSGNDLIFTYDGATKSDTYQIMLAFHTPIVRVRVTGSTNWSYRVNCP